MNNYIKYKYIYSKYEDKYFNILEDFVYFFDYMNDDKITFGEIKTFLNQKYSETKGSPKWGQINYYRLINFLIDFNLIKDDYRRFNNTLPSDLYNFRIVK